MTDSTDVPPPSTTLLVRTGFEDLAAARTGLAELGEAYEVVLEHLAKAADPDLALRTLLSLRDAVEAATDGRTQLLAALAADDATACRLVHVLGASQALGEHLVRHPDHWQVLQDDSLPCTRSAAWRLREQLLQSVGPTPTATPRQRRCPTRRPSTT
ncbi:hypothetical protein [Nocardioides daphniae]|uniref:hypothetical protein n=1 Tax=Nocardioides daphniae TaxID=402297 RepID=UPI0019311341|nr:hypothetical protein [Nocardioides daphniae]